ncbi:MAG: hypothetical protein IJ497_03190, partial [Clostridia bacterium]|nr:hypothetical protein [Clostridia bacterium]
SLSKKVCGQGVFGQRAAFELRQRPLVLGTLNFRDKLSLRRRDEIALGTDSRDSVTGFTP